VPRGADKIREKVPLHQQVSRIRLRFSLPKTALCYYLVARTKKALGNHCAPIRDILFALDQAYLLALGQITTR
jgi:hypothetical protein